MKELLIDYNTWMISIFGDNTILVAAVSSVLLSAGMAVAYKLPQAISRLIYRTGISKITIDSGSGVYNNVMTKLNELEDVANRLGHYTIHSHGWWGGDPVIVPGTGARLINTRKGICLITSSTQTLDDKLLHVTSFHVLRSQRKEFVEWLSTLGVDPPVRDTEYTVIQRVSGNVVKVQQPKAVRDGTVPTAGSLEAVARVKAFIDNKAMYTDNAIPYKLGLLLTGGPGVGKTSVVRYIASLYDYDIVVANSITDIPTLVNESSGRSYILLIEELDLVLGETDATKDNPLAGIMGDGVLAEALKALDGIALTPGRLLIATTNHLERLDKALIRPGRFDHIIEFQYLSKEEFCKFVKKYYNCVLELAEFELTSEGLTPAILQQDFLSLTQDEFMLKHTTRSKI